MLKLPINWMKFAEAMSSMNPYGPVIMSDGTIYSPDGRRLAPATPTATASATAAMDLTGRAQPRDARRPQHATAALAI